MQIKNKQPIISYTKGKNGNPTKLVLKNGTKLGEVIDKLPHGIIRKNHTGIGATTVELKSKRNSIIVEPLKAIASTKAHEYKDVFYYGSETNLHPNKATKDQIKSFVNDDKIEYKKFMVVINSLPTLIDIIGRDNLKEYFLMVDESDSLQMDSSFRGAPMERAMYYYKLWPLKKRCLVTASPVEHNDPHLKKEPITFFDYEKPIGRKITVIKTDDSLLSILNKLQNLTSNHSQFQKIVIAYNNIDEAVRLADKLTENGEYDDQEVKILCSKTNELRVGKYFSELISSEWPVAINIITSAYYSGFDINERYHLIVVIDGSGNCISPKRLKQIAGRCRHSKGLFSETFVYRYFAPKKYNFTLKELLSKAQLGVQSLECLTNTLRSEAWQNQIDEITSRVVDSLTESTYQIVIDEPDKPEKIDKKFSIAYLAIDALLELKETTHKYYLNKNSLILGLRELGNEVDEVKESYSDDRQDKTVEELKAEIRPLLKSATGGIFGPLKYKPFKEKQWKVLKIMRKFRKLVNNDQLVEMLTATYASSDSKISNRISQRLEFFVGKYGTGLKLALKEYLPVDSKVYNEEIPNQVKKILEIIDPSKEINRPTTQQEAVTLFNHWVGSTPATRDFTGKLYRRIKNHNPEGFQPFTEE